MKHWLYRDVYGHLLEGDKQAAAPSMSRALVGGCSVAGSERVKPTLPVVSLWQL